MHRIFESLHAMPFVSQVAMIVAVIAQTTFMICQVAAGSFESGMIEIAKSVPALALFVIALVYGLRHMDAIDKRNKDHVKSMSETHSETVKAIVQDSKAIAERCAASLDRNTEALGRVSETIDRCSQ